ncbi:hypothetical protein [Paludibacterium purpuratum]|uniref:Uncharacterized protein n=1 Tax=Paludibacterium purpuratum TaxID=1144873 RepID=A0A4R7BCU1_9NEIS|nr:hypothetical protein [Paludibacterium purpuratum]TDR81437.1 hypothetical protein DFP86_10390 [Paludibacterium purpuratum]
MNHWQQIDHDFLLRFPGGLADPDWLELGKKHKSVTSVIRLCEEGLAEHTMAAALAQGRLAPLIETCRQIIGRSTTVSTFEKMAFRNYLGFSDIHQPFLQALYELLHHFGPESFANFVDVLQLCRHDHNANPAKWPVVTCFLAYSKPFEHVCIKPTTIKKVAARLGVDIAYQALPNHETYTRVQGMVQSFRQHSTLAQDQNNIIAQAIMYCTV